MSAARGTVVSVMPRHAGLGNRMRALLGARSLARREARGFAYVWPTGRSFGAQLRDLWDDDARDDAARDPARDDALRRLPGVAHRALRLRYPHRDWSLHWLDDARDERVWLVRTGHALVLPDDAQPWPHLLRELRPAPAVADRVVRLARRLAGEPYVGVMVRAHHASHPETLRWSPVGWFVERMRRIEQEQPGVRFLLSCDVPRVQHELLAAFPGAVAQDDKGAYNSRHGLVAAVADLYLLAGASHLLGPHYSSFPELAVHLAGPPLVLETSRTPTRDGPPLVTVPDPLRPHVGRRDVAAGSTARDQHTD
ncbi:hypothetical protein J1G43_17060 [Cellulomonas sp. zg-ZUI22]|uniref:hypothetical protein n=1 Tax=Cellulomonas sp. zg-ZUI22 TaxID=2816955 RepID=UPI001A947FF7|nr:hypothetical protein [Cellulomonas sp. zg-ZUI22]MBO0901673.1 hypothetical protein [Cellulomonas sp. zg-ZUI22]